jgi:ABC-type Fe3+-hydroxamate transport system substrate-binding protein
MHRAKVSSFLLAVALAAALSGCATSTKMEIGSSWNEAVDFSAYKTFAFREDRQLDDFFRQRLAEKYITEDLARKGITLDKANPSMLIGLSPEVGLTVDRDVVPVGAVVWTTWGAYDGLMLSAGRSDFKEAGVVLGIRDAKTRELLFRASASGMIPVGEPDKLQKKLFNALAEMLSKFPPKK